MAHTGGVAQTVLSAVSPTGSRHGGQFAGCQPATQQTTSLRYAHAHLRFGVPRLRGAEPSRRRGSPNESRHDQLFSVVVHFAVFGVARLLTSRPERVRAKRRRLARTLAPPNRTSTHFSHELQYRQAFFKLTARNPGRSDRGFGRNGAPTSQ